MSPQSDLSTIIDGLLHVSEMAPHRVKNPANEVSEGQEIMVKVIGEP